MNNPNPFVPQGSLLEQKNKARFNLKIKIFCLLAINIIGLMVLLMQGCKREQTPPETTNQPVVETNLPPVETNLPPPAVASNLPPPVVETTPQPAPVPSTTEYVVQKGDSFYSIGKKMGVSMKAITDANPGVDSKKLKIGQKLVIPAAAGAAPAAAAGGTATAAPEAGEQTYAVKSGDTLTKIAAHFGTTVKAIRAANNLTTDKIKVGQKLKIPAKAAVPALPPAPLAPVEPAPVTPAPMPAPASPPPGQ